MEKKMKTSILQRNFLLFLVLLMLLMLPLNQPYAQTGGKFEITQSVISNGGQNSAGGTFSLDGTIGQSIAGNALNEYPFAVTSGFWNFTPFGPTAANVTVSGRVLTMGGRPISNALVTLTNHSGVNKTTRTNPFGYFSFTSVEVGETYILDAHSKSYTFAPEVVFVTEDISTLNFTAL
jgi:hypothetical protein